MSEPHINSCKNCQCLNEDSESEMGYTYYKYLFCDKFEHYMNLKSFPFKKEMPCFEMSFWAAIEVDDEIKAIYDKEDKAIVIISELKSFEMFKQKYPITSKTI